MYAPAKRAALGSGPIAPTLEEWRALSPAERQGFLEEVLAAQAEARAARAAQAEALATQAEARAEQAEARIAEVRQRSTEALQRSVLAVLEAHRIPILEEVRAQVLASKDEAELERWVARAAVAPDAAEVVRGEG